MDKKILPNEVMMEEVAGLLQEGREVSFTPKGNSMLPFIRGGKDSVTLRRMVAIKVGDIVLARLDKGQYVMHRVIGIEGDRLTLMGDGNLSECEQCAATDVIGTAVAINGHKPSRGRIWHRLKPLRRYILAIYRRII
jgi:hypothetical protein